MRTACSKIAVLLTLSCAPFAHAGTIYLCKAYSGGTFWSNAHCQTHNALIQRMVSVPDGLPFEQQVHLGNQAAAEGARLAAPPLEPPPQRVPRSGVQAECAALDARIEHLDSVARQPQSGATQDRVKAERQAARDKQFRLKCR